WCRPRPFTKGSTVNSDTEELVLIHGMGLMESQIIDDDDPATSVDASRQGASATTRSWLDAIRCIGASLGAGSTR
ncbi:unnamed protein product, partial [Amoebophrya sp. A25]